MSEPHNEHTPSEETVPFQELLDSDRFRGYGLCDWADAIIADRGTDRSADTRIMQDAEWWAPDNQTRYRLTRTDYYDGKDSNPIRMYNLRAYTATSGESSTRYTYEAGKSFAKKFDVDGKTGRGMRGRRTYQEMMEHLQTAQVDPSASLAAPIVIDGILREIKAKDFGLRYKLGRFVSKVTRQK